MRSPVRCSRLRTAALLVLLGAAVAAPSPPAAPPKPPPDFAMKKADDSPGQVTFSHVAHRSSVRRCSSCHMRDFKMQRGQTGPITLTAKQEGKFCGACHDGKTAMAGRAVFPIDECDKCHK